MVGDYLNVSVYREDVSYSTQQPHFQKLNTAQYSVTGQECEIGLANVPLNFIGGGSIGFQPNTRYKFEVQVMRGIIGSTSRVVGSGIASLIDKGMYSTAQNALIYDGSKLWLSLRYASDYVAAGYKGYRIDLNTANVNSMLSIGADRPTSTGDYGTLHPNTKKMWSYLSSTTANRMTWKAYDSVRDVQMDLVFSTTWELFKKYPVLIFSDDARYAVMCYVTGSNGSTAVQYTAPLVFDDTTLQYRALNGGEAFDLSNTPMYPNVGSFSNGGLYNNPGYFSGMWSVDGSVFLKILPIGGYNSIGQSPSNQYLPTLYEVSERQATGRHTLIISPSNESLLNTLRKLNVIDRAYAGINRIYYNYKIFNTGNYVYVYPYVGSESSSAFLLERVGNTWNVHTVFVSSQLSHIPDSVDDLYDTVLHFPNLYLITSIKMFMLGDDEVLVMDAGNGDVPLVDVNMGNILNFASYNLSTKDFRYMSIGE